MYSSCSSEYIPSKRTYWPNITQIHRLNNCSHTGKQYLRMLYCECLACKGIIPVLFGFFLNVVASLQAVFSNQAFCSEAKQSWRCHSRNSKDLKPFTVIKEVFFGLSCGTTMSCGGVSKSNILERFLGFGLSYVQRMTPNEVEQHQSLRTPLLSEIESDFSSQFRGIVQHRCCL